MATTLFRTSGDVTADHRYAFARDLAARGDFAAAADLLAQTVELAPGFAAAWFALGEARETLGQAFGAIAAFQQALVRSLGDPYGASLRLVRLGAIGVGDMPPNYVRDVFDQYAKRFDDTLTRELSNRGRDSCSTRYARLAGRAARISISVPCSILAAGRVSAAARSGHL